MDEKTEAESIRKQSRKFELENQNQIEESQKQTHPEVGEDATQYGEFVSSYFAWVPLPKQKEKVEEMSEMTKKGKKEPVQNFPRRRNNDI